MQKMLLKLNTIPHITWEARIWDNTNSFNLDDILQGKKDTYIHTWAQAAARYANPILLRPFHEFNSNWFPWSVYITMIRPLLS